MKMPGRLDKVLNHYQNEQIGYSAFTDIMEDYGHAKGRAMPQNKLKTAILHGQSTPTGSPHGTPEKTSALTNYVSWLWQPSVSPRQSRDINIIAPTST
jgi:hypothetical protein